RPRLYLATAEALNESLECAAFAMNAVKARTPFIADRLDQFPAALRAVGDGVLILPPGTVAQRLRRGREAQQADRHALASRREGGHAHTSDDNRGLWYV